MLALNLASFSAVLELRGEASNIFFQNPQNNDDSATLTASCGRNEPTFTRGALSWLSRIMGHSWPPITATTTASHWVHLLCFQP